MLSADLLRQIRRLRFKARRVVDTLFGGDARSIFKGAGITFEDVREYQPGDDVRAIDWNVTARLGHPFIKRFVEERELTIVLVLDVSGSQQFGTGRQSKSELAAELAAVLAFCAVATNDRIGLLLVSDRLERFVPPGKGVRQTVRILRDVLTFKAERNATALATGLDALNRVIRRRALVFVVSDYLDAGYEVAFRRAARRHDVIAVRLTDPREQQLPRIGLLEIEDAETGDRLLVDSHDSAVRTAFEEAARQRSAALRQFLRGAGADYLEISKAGGHLEQLVQFLRNRERRFKRNTSSR